MTVYIESVILDNFFATWLISDVSYRALSLARSRLRILSASAAGTASAVLYPFLKIHPVFLITIKMALFTALSFILFYKKTRRPVSASAVFLALTFTFGGLLLALGLGVYGDVEKALRLPVTNLPIGLILAGGWGAYLLSRKAARKLKRVRDVSCRIYDCTIEALGKTVSTAAFLDTGNRLYDEKTDLPVMVLGARASLQILDDEKLSAILRGKEREICDTARYIKYKGVGDGKKSRLLLIKPDAVRFYTGQADHTIKDVMLGLSFARFSDAAEYDVLLHPALMIGQVY